MDVRGQLSVYYKKENEFKVSHQHDTDKENRTIHLVLVNKPSFTWVIGIVCTLTIDIHVEVDHIWYCFSINRGGRYFLNRWSEIKAFPKTYKHSSSLYNSEYLRRDVRGGVTFILTEIFLAIKSRNKKIYLFFHQFKHLNDWLHLK